MEVEAPAWNGGNLGENGENVGKSTRLGGIRTGLESGEPDRGGSTIVSVRMRHMGYRGPQTEAAPGTNPQWSSLSPQWSPYIAP